MSALDQLLQPSEAPAPYANALRTLIRAVSSAAQVDFGEYSAAELEQIAEAVRVVFQNACYAKPTDDILAELGLINKPAKRLLVRRRQS